MNELPIAELRKLLADVSRHGTQHIIEVEADLLQTQFLLTEAIENLGKSFEDIYQSIGDQQTLLDRLLSTREVEDDHSVVKQLDSIKARIGSDVSSVVTAMQFQDLTSQLIVRSLQRLTGIKEILEALGTHGHSDDACYLHEQTEIMEYIEELKEAINIKSHALKGGFERKQVNQQNMETGDIELF
jgi:DNA-binding transcriptional MerR regulator